MDKKITNNLILGIFVSLGFLLFILLVFNMGGGQGILSSQYTLYGKFRHVKGVHFGSEVALSGLRVGTVKDITISAEDSKMLIVEMAINKKVQKQIREDSMANVVTQGVLGDKYIEITIGSATSPVLPHKAQIKTNEVDDLFSKSGDLVEGISRHFNKGGDIDMLLKNLNSVSQNLNTLTSEAARGKTGDKFGKSMDHLESILRKIDSGEGTLGALVNDPTVYEDVKSVLGGAKRSSVLQYFMKSFRDEGAQKKSPSQQKQ